MDPQALSTLVSFLLLAALVSGPAAILRALTSAAGAVGIVFLGLAAGIAALALSLKVEMMQVAAARRAGEPIVNDMAGFGQALLLLLGLAYFGMVLLIVTAIALWRRFAGRERAPR